MEIENFDSSATYQDFPIRIIKTTLSKGVVSEILQPVARESIFYVPTGSRLELNNSTELLDIIDSEEDVIASLQLVDEDNYLFPRISIGGGHGYMKIEY